MEIPKMGSREFVSFVIIALAIVSPLQVFAQPHSANILPGYSTEPSTPFSVSLDVLQIQINYTFESIGLLRRAMTHASFSEENNKVLSILGVSVIEASVALNFLVKDLDISPKDLRHRISVVCNVKLSCAKLGKQLGLQNVVRVSPKIDSSMPPVVCGAFRALIGAVAVDSGKSDEAGSVFLSVLEKRNGSRRASSR